MNLLDLPAGIHDNVPAEVYHQRVMGVVSTGVIKMLATQTPAHYRSWLDSGDDAATPSMLLGTALHACVLEPDVFSSRFFVKDFDLRTKDGKARQAELLSSYPLATFIDAETFDTVRYMRDALAAHPTASSLMFGHENESTVLWEDSRSGLQCKSRPDVRARKFGVLADLKSTDNASPRAFARTMANFLYHVQAEHYLQGERAVGHGDMDFVFVAQERIKPYAIGIYQADRESLNRARDIRDEAMAVMTECLCYDRWDAYPTDIQTLSLPAWAFQD